MNFTIVKEKETPLLSRKRITGEVTFDGPTPSKADISKQLSKSSKQPENLIEIRHIYTQFGEQKAKVIAHIYDDETVMGKVVSKGKKKSGGK